MIHDAIRQREPGRRVLELDVSGERRLSGEDDRRGESGESGEARREREAVEPGSSPWNREPHPAMARAATSGVAKPAVALVIVANHGGDDHDRESGRKHERGLLKGLPHEQLAQAENAVREVWKARTGAHRVEVRELRAAGGVTAYLALHHE